MATTFSVGTKRRARIGHSGAASGSRAKRSGTSWAGCSGVPSRGWRRERATSWTMEEDSKTVPSGAATGLRCGRSVSAQRWSGARGRREGVADMARGGGRGRGAEGGGGGGEGEALRQPNELLLELRC